MFLWRLAQVLSTVRFAKLFVIAFGVQVRWPGRGGSDRYRYEVMLPKATANKSFTTCLHYGKYIFRTNGIRTYFGRDGRNPKETDRERVCESGLTGRLEKRTFCRSRKKPIEENSAQKLHKRRRRRRRGRSTIRNKARLYLPSRSGQFRNGVRHRPVVWRSLRDD